MENIYVKTTLSCWCPEFQDGLRNQRGVDFSNKVKAMAGKFDTPTRNFQ